MTSGEDFKPIQTAGGLPTEEGWLFHAPNRDLNINAYQKEISEIVNLCNGINTKEQILGHLATQNLDIEICDAIINDLNDVGIIADSREQHLRFHETGNNPSPYFRDLSPEDISDLTRNDPYIPREGIRIEVSAPTTSAAVLLEKRESCRSFSEEIVPTKLVVSALHAAYSVETRPIPSAGGLYPLRFYYIKRSEDELSPGIYQYDHMSGDLIDYGVGLDEEALRYALNSETFVFNADSVIVIAADIKRHSSKYANRGYRYSLIEAGHAAQNIHLALAEHDVSSIEYGGFNDSALKEGLDLEPFEVPLITIGLGYKSEQECVTGLDIADKLSTLVGEDKPIEWVEIDFDSKTAKEAGFYLAFAKFRKPNEAYGSEEHQFASGTATSIQMAFVKAVAEAYERYKGGQFWVDRRDAAKNLDYPWLDPRIVRPLTKEQIETNDRIKKLDESEVIDWVKVKRLPKGDEYYAPADIVFYPLDSSILGRKPVAEADSSGMAAHTDKDTAIRKATLELVERDAIMRNWFEKRSNERISHAALDETWQKRIRKIEQHGRKVDIVDLSHSGIVILNIIIRADEGGVYPYFVNGSAASDTSFEEAFAKAFDEAELGFLEAMNQEEVDVLDPVSVRSPADHGKLYLHDTYKKEIEWLWRGPLKNTLPKVTATDIIGQFRPYIVEFTKDESPLYVVRALCPQLVPINFGFGNEHYTHISVQKDSRVRPRIPHYFA